MMDRDHIAAAQPAQTIRKETALEQLSSFANRADHIGDLIEGFLARCKGSEDDQLQRYGMCRAAILAQLERLDKLLQRAEELAGELGNVG
jgi:ATP-dependent protease HslVU (ClpYQ) peptidase subunit